MQEANAETNADRLMMRLSCISRKLKHETLNDIIKNSEKDIEKELEEKILKCNIDYVKEKISFETANYDISIRYVVSMRYVEKKSFYIDYFFINRKEKK